jgi:hypothetical protein
MMRNRTLYWLLLPKPRICRKRSTLLGIPPAGIQPGKLPENKTALNRLREKLASLALPVPEKRAIPKTAEVISGRTYRLEANERNLEEVTFRFADSLCKFTLHSGGQEYQFILGNGYWEYGETTKLGPNLLLGALGHFEGLPPAKIAGAFTWINDNTLEITIRYIESPHRETWQFAFDGKKLNGNLRFSNMFDRVKWEFKGHMIPEKIKEYPGISLNPNLHWKCNAQMHSDCLAGEYPG